MVKCHIRECESLEDPMKSPEIMSDLSDIRREAIMKYKMEADRKRSLAAGLLIRDALIEQGKSQDDIVITDKGRPTIEGMDFNVSHSGRYAVIAVSQDKVGCDIEHVKDRNYSVAKRYFTEDELAWIENANNKEEAFYRIWTARESYSKLTGEGILLEFNRYEIRPEVGALEPKGIIDEEALIKEGNPRESTHNEARYLGSCEVIREGHKQDYIIHQWLYDKEYIISICFKA